MTRIWQIPDLYPEEIIGEYDSACSPDRFLFRQGRQLGVLPPAKIRFGVRVAQLLKFDCLAHSGMIPLVSQQLASFLSKNYPDEVQLFPAVVIAADAELTEYSLVNATHEVAAVDYAASSSVLIPGTKAVMKFNRLRHRPGALNGIHIARERDYRSHLITSSAFATELLQMGFTGLQFTRPEEIHP